MYQSFRGYIFLFLLGMPLGVELLGHVTYCMSDLKTTLKHVVVLFYTSTEMYDNSVVPVGTSKHLIVSF